MTIGFSLPALTNISIQNALVNYYDQTSIKVKLPKQFRLKAYQTIHVYYTCILYNVYKDVYILYIIVYILCIQVKVIMKCNVIHW